MDLAKLGFNDVRSQRKPLTYQQAPLFYIGYVLWFVIALLNTTTFSTYLGHVTILYSLIPCIMLIHEFANLRSLSLNEVLFVILLVVLNIQTYYFGQNNLLAFSIILFCGRKISFREIAKLTIILQIVVVSFIIPLSLSGLISNVTNVRLDGTLRQAFGFQYVTYLSYTFLNIVLLWIYLKKSKIDVFQILVLGLTNTLIFVFTDARNGCFLVYAALFIACIFKYLRGNGSMTRLISSVLQYDFIIYTGITVALLFATKVLSGTSIYSALDSFGSSRLTYSSYAFEHFGFPIIGGTSIDLASAGLILDSSYLRIIYDHGFVVLIFVLFLITCLQRAAFKLHDYLLLALLFIVATHSFFDAQLISFQQNTFLFLLGTAIPGGITLKQQENPDGELPVINV
jgi:hypothetical protein